MIKQLIAEILNPVSDSLFALVMAVPMSVVRCIFLGILALLALWVLTMPSQYPGEGEGKKKIRNDLRLFAVGILILQALFYIIF